MKNNKILISIIMIVFILLGTINYANAANINANIALSTNEIKQGDNITVSLKLQDFEGVSKGINAYKAKIEYDKEIFETINISDFICKNNWTDLKYNPQNQEFVAINKMGTTQEEVVEIKLKAKNNAKQGNTTITIKELEASDGKGDILISQTNKTIEVINLNQETNKKDEQVNDEQLNNGTGQAEGGFPEAGIRNKNRLLLLIIIVLSFTAIYFYKKQKSITKQTSKKILYSIIFSLVLVGQLSTVIYAVVNPFYTKGEVNDDGQINYTDVHLMQKHLIKLEQLPNNKLENADMNSDSKITVTDLTLLIRKIENNLDYDVNITESDLHNHYQNKNEDITLNFLANVSFGGEIDKVIVNEKEYIVEKLEETSSEFKITLPKEQTSGVKEYEFTKVILKNNKTVKVDYTAKVDILKDKPFIHNYTVNENIDNSSLDVEFELKDNDNALTSVRYEVIDEEQTNIKEEEIKSGKNKITLNVTENKKYYFNIYINYNLDTDTLKEKDNTGFLEESKELKLIIDYQFKLDNIEIHQDLVKTSTLTKDKDFILRFRSANNTNFYPEKIKVNGSEYPVTKQSNYFEATIKGLTELGNKTIKLEEVVLNNGKVFEQSKNIEVEVIKQKPTITNLETQEDVQSKKLNIKFDLIDDYAAVKNAKIVLLDEDKNKISEQEITGKNIDIELNTKITSKYIIQVIADYNLSISDDSSQEYLQEILIEKEIDAQARAEITNVDISEKYPNKNETITINYEIESNKKSEITHILVNSIQYEATKQTNQTYDVQINVGNKAGILDINTTKVIFEDGTESKVDNNQKVDVLKDLPFVENYHIEDNLTDSKVIITFDLLDTDKSFETGKAELVKQTDNTKQEKTIQVGKNTLEFTVEEKVLYDFNVIVNTDLDTDTLEETQDLNKVQNKKIYTQEIEQIADYKLTISGIKTYKNTILSNYFEKNEKINLEFTSTNVTDFYPIKAIINGKELTLNKNGNTYKTEIDGYYSFGEKQIVIEKIILNNLKELNIEKDNKTKIEILKEKPKVENFLYEETQDNKISISLDLIDAEDTIINAKLIVTDENSNKIKETEISVGKNTVLVDKNDSENYNTQIVASYDLDNNAIETGKNEYQNKELLNNQIDVSERLIEIKDIQTVELYRKNNNDVENVTTLNLEELSNLNDYIVKLSMKEQPSFYTTIEEYNIEDNKLKFTLDYEKVIKYEENKQNNKLEVTYGLVNNNIATQTTLETLIKKIKENPDGTFELTQDINADINVTGNTIVDSSIVFTGKLNGNGYKIYNLNKPLFNSINGAIIENLIIEQSSLANNARGFIANEVNNATIISNVHAKDVSITSTSSETGILVGTMKTSSQMRSCSATEITITSNSKRTGGLVGAMSNSIINNCYVKGEIASTQDGVGGITGFAQNVTISNTYSQVTFNTTTGPNYNGGFVGHSSGVKIVNCLSLSTGQKGRRFIGTGEFNNGSSNNYEISTSTLESNSGSGGVNSIEFNEIKDVDFYKEELGMDENIWNYSNATEGKTPTLKNADPNNSNKELTKPINENLNIPEYTRLRKLSNYDTTKEIAYHNLYKLIPFYDAKYLLVDGNKLDTTHELNTKLIKDILAIDKNDNTIVYLTNKNQESIKKIKIIFEDNTTKTYNVTYYNYYGNVASYKINELNIYYNFDRFVLKQDASIINTLTQHIKNINYTDDLDILTTNEDSRLYKDYFNENTIKEADKLILKILNNHSDYLVTLDNEILNTKIENELIKQGRLKEIVYAYNYYKRWYNIEIGEIKIHDIILFNGDLFSKNMKLDTMVNEVLLGNNIQTGSTQTFYANNIAKYSGLSNIGIFIDYFITTIGEYKDVNDWLTQNYQGIVHEVNIDNRPDIEYRAWQQLKKRNNFLLPFLTLPENAAYIVSSPTQFLVGAQKTYIVDPTNETQKEQLVEKIENYGKIIKSFYTTTAGFIEKEYLNPYADIQVDHRFIKNANGQSEYQSASTTEDDFHKNFNEAVGFWAAANGSAAYATGTNVYWNAYPALSSFSTWSHESGHNQDSKVFLKGKGRRPKGWAEDYADGNTTQDFGDGAFNFNLSQNYTMDSSVTTNLTPERINSTDKINSYYREMFKASDFLDYIEAKAFLTLSPTEQAKVAVQVFYPNKENGTDEEKDAGDEITGWRILTEEQIKAMKLTKVEDLWDNKITIKPGITGESTRGTNQYGADGIYSRHWYQQHNDNGRPDSYALKQLAWEMLGYAGYDNGYITYYSGKSQTDLDAIRKITNNENMTWKKYKMDRYNEMENQWNNMTYIDPDEVLEQYKQALKIDAERDDRNITASTNVKRMNYHYLKRVTNDFETNIFTTQVNAIHIKTAKELQEQITNKPNGYFVLDNNIDVSSLTGTTSLISKTFVGKLDGNGNKIIGNTLPIFEKIKYAQISNLIIEDSEIQINDTQVGALSRLMEASSMKNVHIVNANIQGTNRTGAIIGYATNSKVEECSSNATVIATGNAVGGLIGQYDNSTIKNSYSLGSVKGKQDIGGFIGWAENSFIENSYSAAEVESTANVAGGFIGQIRGTSKIKNNISFANIKNGYKFDGRSANAMFAKFENNYEYEEAKGTSTLNRTGIDFTGKIISVGDNKIMTEDFYNNILSWNSSIWDYKNITAGGLPKLKNLDINNVTQIIEKTEISSLQEFLEIDNAPNKYYVLTNNIDFTNYTETDAVLKEIFTGKIDGKGFTLSNLSNATIFNNFRGVAQNLKIKNFKNEKENINFVTAFSKETYGATLKNITFEGITLKGQHNVAPIGMDGRENANSTFENITVKNANVKGTGVYVAAFIGRKYGGKITNCYVEGNVECYTTECGGISGATHQNVQIENVISNVNINRPRSTDNRNQNGGFIGNIYNSPTIKNCISIGSMTGYVGENNEKIDVNKFTGAGETMINSCLQNCYELKESTGVSNVTENTNTSLKEVNKATLKTIEFYKNILSFNENIWNFDTINTLGYPTIK